MSKIRKVHLTRNMKGILLAIHFGGKYSNDPISYIPNALIRLAKEGYVKIGRRVLLTTAGVVRAHFLIKDADTSTFPRRWREM